MVKFREPDHTPSELKKLIDYNSETGSLEWAHGSRRSGPAFNSKHSGGYRFGMLEGAIYYQHRVAWAIYYGVWPLGELDHINGNRADNRISNLRDATRQENQSNRHIPANNTSGVMGVVWHEPSQRWHVTITVDGEVMSGGYYEDLADAAHKRKVLEFWYGFGPTHGTKRSALRDIL